LTNKIEINAIVALAENNVIGNENGLIWNIPEDLKNLKKLTMGFPIIMGRKTWETIGVSLPGRLNVVLSKNINWNKNDVLKVSSFNEAILKSKLWLNEKKELDIKKIFVFGGGQIYNEGLKYVSKIYITKVFLKPNGNIFFPVLLDKTWKETYKSDIKTTKSGIKFQFIELDKI
tara:strand:- start:33 stop:554 length:522 start_codon:yes stop_codon:yes gene_type:complete